MNVAVLGSGGMLGTYVSLFLSKNHNVVRPNGYNAEDLTVGEALGMLSYYDKVDVVVNCVGVIKQRTAISPRTMIAVNSVFPHTIQIACEKMGIPFIHVTTDCVFDGEKGDYTEYDIHNALDVYGRSKSLGEPENATVIRTSIIGSERKRKLSLLEWVKSQKEKECKGYTKHIWNGVTCLQFAKLVDEIIQKKDFWKGVRHYYSECISKNELVMLISNAYDLNVSVKNWETPIRDMSLSSKKWKFSVPTLQEQLKEMRKFDEENSLHDSL